MSPLATALEKGCSSGNSFALKYCRMCALELKQGVFIFGEEGKRLHIPEKIRKTVSILVLEEDSLPKKICTDCCSSLEDYSQYKDTVLDAQEKLTAIARNMERSQDMLQIQVQQQNQLKLQKQNKIRKPCLDVPSNRNNLSDISQPEEIGDDSDPMSLDNANDGIGETSPVSPEETTSDRDDAMRTDSNLETINVEHETRTKELREVDTTSNSSETLTKLVEPQEIEEDDVRSLLCGLCGKPMGDRTELENHHKKCHDLEKYSVPVYGCSFCPRISENFNAIRIHIYRHRKEGAFKCSECEKMFPVKDQLDRHVLAAHNNGLKPFSCKMCGKRFAAKCSLVVHMNSKHSTSTKESDSPTEISNEVFDQNDLLIPSPERLEEEEPHLQTQSTSEKVQQADSFDLMRSPPEGRHIEASKASYDRKKAEKKEGNSETGIWQCEYCDKIHQTLSGYQSHVATHKGRRFACEVCSAVFTQKAALSHHVTTQHSQIVKELRCTVCSKEFKTSKCLKMHMQFHTNNNDPDSKETCPVCQKVYKSKAHLKSHLKIHKSQKNFLCSTCGKAFVTQQKLNDHKNSHTGARPYKCTYCEYTASHVGQYYRHKNTHRKELQLVEGKSTFNGRVQEPQSHANSLGSNSSEASVSTDLSTKSPQKIQQAHSSLANNSSTLNTNHQSMPNNQQSSVSSQQPGTISQSQVLSATGVSTSNVEVLHSSSQTYSHSQQMWSSPNGTIQGGRGYQNLGGTSTGLNGIDLVDCAIQHTLTSEDLSSHSTSHIHNYSPNNQSSSSHIVHTNHNNVSLSNFVTTSSPTTTATVAATSLSGSHSQPHQSEPMELSYKLQIESSEFQDMPMELTKVFQRDPLELCVRQDFNPLMDLSSRVVNVADPNGMNMNSMSMSMNLSNNGMNSGMNGMGMGYHKLDITERELSFNDLSGAFRQPIDLIARTDDASHELCSEGNLVDLSLRSSFVQDQSASSFLRELIDLSARSDSFHGELNLTNKHHHQTSHVHLHHSNNNNHHGNSSGAMNKHTGGNGNHHHHHGNGAGSLQNVIYQDAMFSLQN